MKQNDRIGKVVVAVIGQVGDWAAYELPFTPDGEARDIDEVARHGDKISQEAAEALFPEMKRAGLIWRD